MNTLRNILRWIGISRGLAPLFPALALLLGCPHGAHAAPPVKQFDVFLGYDGIVPEGNWFPVICEVANDGPGFNAIFELTTGQFNQSQTRRYAVELPSGTRKRFVIPTFLSGRFGNEWRARLLDASGGKRGDLPRLQARKTIGRGATLLGAVPRGLGGLPVFPDVNRNRPDSQPLVARMQPELFPDNPLALEGLNALYINSEKALELKAAQANAILAWVANGGHLIVGVEQVADVKSTAWLNDIVPCDMIALGTIPSASVLQNWLTSSSLKVSAAWDLPPPGWAAPARMPGFACAADAAFNKALMPIVSSRIRDGRVLVGTESAPLVVTAHRGRGQVTVLNFSPEREPFRSWQNRKYFWAKLLDVPPSVFAAGDYRNFSAWGIDGVFGAMIDSKQVRKLPVGWLLFLLAIYLAVIGPLDYFILKRLNRQMLTWLTFPAYVALFSLLIYFIGYKLRAGETEWNEFHVVDILPGGAGSATLRGYTFASIYSPVNANYRIGGPFVFGTLRGESSGGYGGGQGGGGQIVVDQGDAQFSGEVSVPVWTSQLFVSDWLQRVKSAPLQARVTLQGQNWELKLENSLPHKLSQVAVVIQDRVYEVGEVASKGAQTFQLPRYKGMALQQFVQQYGNAFQNAISQRGRALGNEQVGRLQDIPHSAMAASFASMLNNSQGYWRFMPPTAFDLSSLAERGDAIILARVEDHSLIASLNQFSPRRSKTDTLLRLAFPVNSPTLSPAKE